MRNVGRGLAEGAGGVTFRLGAVLTAGADEFIERGRTMSQTGLAQFDSTLQTTNSWLKELLERLGWEDRHRAYHALRTVLHALRDRLTVDEDVTLGAQLPMLVRGFYYEGWHLADKPLKERRKESFLSHIASAFRDSSGIDPEEVARAVFQVMARHVSSGEIESVKQSLPGEIRSLWT